MTSMDSTALQAPAALPPANPSEPASVQKQQQQQQWIISRSADLTWFIGSAAAGYLALALMAAGFPLLPLVAIWLLGVDGPHVIATITRTYFDKAERQKLGALLWIPIPLFLVGPLMVVAGWSSVFFLLAVCWQHYHIVKQHFGFVMLYKAKRRERDRTDFLLDRWFLLSSLFAPLALFVLRTRPALSALAPVHWLVWALVGANAALGCAWVARQAQNLRAGVALNIPKIALMLVVVPLQWLALLHASYYGPGGIIRAGIALGLFHSFQYHRLLWFHNRNRYTQDGPSRERYGLAVEVASSLLAYLGVAIGLHFLLMYLPTLVFPGEAVVAAIWSFSFTHYILDSKIWHVRADKDLAVALHLA